MTFPPYDNLDDLRAEKHQDKLKKNFERINDLFNGCPPTDPKLVGDELRKQSAKELGIDYDGGKGDKKKGKGGKGGGGWRRGGRKIPIVIITLFFFGPQVEAKGMGGAVGDMILDQILGLPKAIVEFLTGWQMVPDLGAQKKKKKKPYKSIIIDMGHDPEICANPSRRCRKCRERGK